MIFLIGLMALCALAFVVLLGMKETPVFTGEGFGTGRLGFGSKG